MRAIHGPLGAAAAVDVNEAILYRHGTSGYDPSLRLQDEGAFDAEEKAACIAEIRCISGHVAGRVACSH